MTTEQKRAEMYATRKACKQPVHYMIPRLQTYQIGLGPGQWVRPVVKQAGIFSKESKAINSMGAVLEYRINNADYLIISSLDAYDVCRAPDKTYVCIDRKLKTILGPYPLPK